MNTDIKLDFLYYQEAQILDASDPNMEIYKPQEEKFDNFMVTKSILEIVELIITSYKDKYAQHKFFAGCFYDVSKPMIDTQYPDYLDEHDFYIPKEEMTREDIKHLILRIFKDDYNKTNARYLKELELVFLKPQNLNNTILKALESKEVSMQETNGVIIYTVADSAISEIEISSTRFLMRTNSDKWKAYY